jgi:hypothetical protein
MAISKIKSKSIIDDVELQGGATLLSTEEQEDVAVNGQIRFNQTAGKQEIYANGRWDVVNPQSIAIALNVALGG